MAHPEPNPEPEEEEAVPDPDQEPEAVEEEEAVQDPDQDTEEEAVWGWESPWKAQIRAMLADAANRLAHVRWGLNGVAVYLAPISVHDAACQRDRITLARGTLQGVTDELFFSAALMDALEIHAVKIYELDLYQETALQRALTRLPYAKEYAVNASNVVDGCNSCLLTAFVLLDHPALPGVDPIVKLQHKQAVTVLEMARYEAKDCTTLIRGARIDMAGDN